MILFKEEPGNEDSASESDLENEEIDNIGCVRVVNLGKNQSNAAPVQKLWALILTPTRELAVQIKDHLVAALKYTTIKVFVSSFFLFFYRQHVTYVNLLAIL